MDQPPPYPPQQPGGPWPPQGPQQGPPQGWQGYPPPPMYPPPPRKSYTGLKVFGGIVAFLFVVGSCGVMRNGYPTTVQDTAATPSVAAPAQSPAAQPAPTGSAYVPTFPGAREGDLTTAAGQPITVDGLRLTATELRAGDDTFGAALCTTVTYVNGSAEQQRFGAFDWSMQNPNGAIVSLTFFGGADSQLQSGELAPGGTVTGDLCFEDENATAGTYVLIYESPSFFTNQRLAWLNPR